MIVRNCVTAAMLLAPLPALAQAAPSAPAASVAAPEPARLAAARPVIDRLWPLGTYRRMMDGTMTQLMDAMMNSMFDMKASDMVGGVAGPEATREMGDRTMGELAESADPHFRERMKITTDTLFAEMLPLMDKFEPAIRDSLTTIYARRFTAAQLADMDRFFATPTGKVYAEQWMMTFVDPEIAKNMAAFVPEFTQAMPAILKKVEAATAHLPPPPKPEGGAVDEDMATGEETPT